MCKRSQIAMPCEAVSVSQARGWIDERLHESYSGLDDAIDDAALIVSEIVTNCVNAQAHSFLLALDAHRDCLKVSATDDAPGLPIPRVSHDFDTGGRGLAIVQALATSWGVAPGGADKTVWAELEIPTSATVTFDCEH